MHWSREVVGGGAGGARAPPIIWDFAPIQYLLNRKIAIYCVPLQYKFSDYLPASKFYLQKPPSISIFFRHTIKATTVSPEGESLPSSNVSEGK